MNRIDEIRVKTPRGKKSGSDIEQNHSGLRSPFLSIFVHGKIYSLGGLSDEVCAWKFGGDWVLFDKKFGSAFILPPDGGVITHDCEDEELAYLGERILFISDAGLTVYGNSRKIDCSFNDLNLYFIHIDYSQVATRGVVFVTGDGRELLFSVDELIEMIGSSTQL